MRFLALLTGWLKDRSFLPMADLIKFPMSAAQATMLL